MKPLTNQLKPYLTNHSQTIWFTTSWMDTIAIMAASRLRSKTRVTMLLMFFATILRVLAQIDGAG